MKKRLAGFLAGLALSGALPICAMAAEAVNVTLPAFNVTLNGLQTDSLQSQYPFLVYKGITYVPMTYHDARLLGLETKWSADAGLAIDKAAVFDKKAAAAAYKPYTASSQNAASYQAAVVTGSVAIAGKAIDNAQEEYPLLLFREVTYFPLTWRFAVEEFGWQYNFDAANGLVIMPADTMPADTMPAGETNQLKVTGNVVNIRADNNTDSAVVTQVQEGDVLTVITQKDSWYQVRLATGETGWIASWLVTATSSGGTGTSAGGTTIGPSTSTAPKASGKITITGNVVNVRAASNTDSAVVAKVQSGDVLAYTAIINDWYQVTLADGKTGWVASWLATDMTTSGGNTGSTGGTTSGNTGGATGGSTAGGDTLTIDSKRQLEMAQSGNDTVLTLTGLTSSEYSLVNNSKNSLTIKVASGNFKPQSYAIAKYGIKSVVVTGQLITIQFQQDITYTQKFQNNNALAITIKGAQGTSAGTSGGSSGSGIGAIGANNLKMNYMAPTEAKTVAEISVGADSDIHVVTSTAGKVVLNISNNTIAAFKPQSNTIGPLRAIGARSLGNDQIELTIELSNGAYCVIDKYDNNLLITAKSRSSAQSQGLSGKIIVLDPGHGGSDPGAIGMVLGVTDAAVGLNVCNALKPLLEAQGAKVYMTRSDAAGYMTVGERALYSNDVQADIFVSVHANSAKPKTVPYGTQVYYYAPDTTLTLAAQKPIRMELAKLVSQNISSQTGRKSDIYTKNLGVLRENNAPSILVETGFLSNAEEEALLASPEYINKLANGIYQGLLQYASVK